MRCFKAIVVVIFTSMLLMISALAAEKQSFDDPRKEERAYRFMIGLTCRSCNDIPLWEMDTQETRHIENFIRSRIGAGDSDKEVGLHLAAVYGDFVMPDPTFSFQRMLHRLFYWNGAPFFLVLGLLFLAYRSWRKEAPLRKAAFAAPSASLKGETAMPQNNSVSTSMQHSAGNQGVTLGVVSCFCSILGFFVPVLGFFLALIGFVTGIKAFRAGSRSGNTAAHILGLIGTLLGSIAVIYAAIAALALVGFALGIGFLGG